MRAQEFSLKRELPVLDTIPGGRVYQARPEAKITLLSQTLPGE